MSKLSRARDELLWERRQLDAASVVSTAPNPFVALSAYGGPAFQVREASTAFHSLPRPSMPGISHSNLPLQSPLISLRMPSRAASSIRPLR